MQPVPKPRAQVYIKRQIEHDYLEGDLLPNKEVRLLALFRFWNVIQYFFPYKNLMDKPWDEVLLEYIPRMEAVQSPLEYALTIAELATCCNDSHVK